MKETLIISFLVIFIYIFLIINKNNLVLIESNTGSKMLVHNDKTKEESAELLSKLIDNMYKLKKHLFDNIESLSKRYQNNSFKTSDIKESIVMLNENFTESKTSIYENPPTSEYTSYSVNKGEELAFCLKSKNPKNPNKLHDLNLLTYVALHELSHIGCREIGHTQLFKDIFYMYTKEAIEIDIYEKINYDDNPVEYCGMILSSSIV